MSFVTVEVREDHEQRDAVCRGVAEGLARVFSVVEQPPSIRELLAAAIEDEGDGIVAGPDHST